MNSRQGSVSALINQNGTVSERYSYDAWGRRRNPANWLDYNVKAPRLISRGYTGHEMLDGFGLINMNGRMYDPVIGRILSPDPFVQAPGYTQSYNRYSYCLNNPLRYTDPTGYRQHPDGWDNSGGGGVEWFQSFGPGPNGPIGPGSGNHWSDALRSEYGNFMIGSANSFNNMYGEGASEIAQGFVSDPTLQSQWRQGMISIEQVRQNGGNPNLGPSAGLAGEPGKSVVENQYGRCEYSFQGVWVQTAGKTQVGAITQFVQNEKFNNSEKVAIGFIAISGSVKVTTEIIDKLSGMVKSVDLVNMGKATGVKFGIVGVITTATFAYSDRNFSTGDGVRVLLSGLTFIPYVGWTYGLIDIGTLLVTGTSVTDKIGNYVDHR